MRRKPQRRFWRRPKIRVSGQESEGAIVLVKSGNAEGGKGPRFGHACKEAEVR